MKLIKHNTINYQFSADFKQDKKIRASFNRLTDAVFGFSLESWYQEGLWGDQYIPYSMLHNGEVVSNVSINVIDFDIEGETKSGIQIGTVMTDEKYRNRGLSKILMERVIHEWKEKTDFVYLFANDSVLDFYPKFKFKVVEEYQHFKTVDIKNASATWNKLNMEDPGDAAFLKGRIKEAKPIAKLSMRNNPSLILFYCNGPKKNSVYHLKELDIIVIADVKDDTLYLEDIFSNSSTSIDNVITSIVDKRIKRVVLGFTPLNQQGFQKQLLKAADTLFILKNQAEFFTDKHWMFPLLSHA